VFDPKPTINYPFVNTKGFWTDLEVYQANIMAEAGVLTRQYSAKDMATVLRPRYLTQTFEKLGWNVPKTPPFLPKGWAGTVGNPPYPPYGVTDLGHQEFPESGDLAKPWKFGGKTYQPT